MAFRVEGEGLGLVGLNTSSDIYMGVSENRGTEYSTLNSRILIKRTYFRKLPFLLMGIMT